MVYQPLLPNLKKVSFMPQKLLYFILHRLNMTNMSYTENLFCLIFLLNNYFIDQLKTEKKSKELGLGPSLSKA